MYSITKSNLYANRKSAYDFTTILQILEVVQFIL